MSRRALVFVSLIGFVCILLGWWALQPQPAVPGAAHPAAASGQPDSQTAELGEQRPAPIAALSREGAASTDAPSPSVGAADTVRFVGRCVRARPVASESGDPQPLSGCTATATRVTTESDELPPNGAAATVETSSDGVFELAIEFDSWRDSVRLHITAPGFAPRSARWPRPSPGDVIDLGDIPMARAIAARGVVVDREGIPVAGARIVFANLEFTDSHKLREENMLYARSDDAGRIAFPLPAYVGEWYLGAEDTGALVGPRAVMLDGSVDPFEVRVVVERPDPAFTITGTVTDTTGIPLAGVKLSARGDGFMGRGTSDDQGRFAIARAGPIPDRGEQGAQLTATDPTGRFQTVQPTVDESTSWGAVDQDVVMRRLAQRTVRVRDAAGRPVVDYAALLYRGAGSPLRLIRPGLRGPHQDGVCALPDLRSGPHGLIILPRSKFASTEWVSFDVDHAVSAGEIAVTVHPAIPTTVRVTLSSGTPQPGSTVELLQQLGDEPPPLREALPNLADSDRQQATAHHVVVAHAETDRDGVAELSAPPGTWIVRVRGPAHTPSLHPIRVANPTTELVVTVQQAAAIHGQATPASSVATLQELAKNGDQPLAVVATPVAATGANADRIRWREALPPAPVDAEGRFELSALEPGRYAVGLQYGLRTGEVRSAQVTVLIETVTVRDGERREISIDVRDFLPGTLHGVVNVGGQPLAVVHCFLRRTGPGPLLPLRVSTDRDGRYRGVVPPGDYAFAVTYPADPGPGWVHMVTPGTAVLAPGADQEWNITVPLRRIRVQLLDSDGQPVANTVVRAVAPNYHAPGRLETDENGWFEVYPAPLAPIEVKVTVSGREHILGPVDLQPGQTEGSVSVRLPGS